MASAILRYGRTDQGRGGLAQWWLETRDGYVINGGYGSLVAAKDDARGRGIKVAGIHGKVIYDDQHGHVCLCTEHVYYDEDGLPVYADYQPTVTCDRSSGTESGSFYYSCSRCGAGAWSGL